MKVVAVLALVALLLVSSASATQHLRRVVREEPAAAGTDAATAAAPVPEAAGGTPAVGAGDAAAETAAAEATPGAAGPAGNTVGGLPDEVNLVSGPPGVGGDLSTSSTLPPFNLLSADNTVSPPLAPRTETSLVLDIDRRIASTESVLNRMVWALNRETSWANSVHDIIQNYQYKYSKVLSNIRKHSAATQKMRGLVGELRKARVHEMLESLMSQSSKALGELASVSGESAEDEGSYAALRERVNLLAADLTKMAPVQINKPLHAVQEGIKEVEADAIPSASQDTLKDVVSESAEKST